MKNAQAALAGRPENQMACKPGSVSHCWGDDYSSRPPVAGRLKQPTRVLAGTLWIEPLHAYSVLLPVRFAWLRLLPNARWALTPPFHPYHPKMAVCLCGTISKLALGGRYPPPFPWSPDFPRGNEAGLEISLRPDISDLAVIQPSGKISLTQRLEKPKANTTGAYATACSAARMPAHSLSQTPSIFSGR